MYARQPTGEYLDEWAAGLRLGASTMASCRKNIRPHLKPYLGAVPVRTLSTVRIDAVYRQLEARDHQGVGIGQPLSARTVWYVHTILSAELAEATEAGRLARNPAAAAHPADCEAGEGAGGAGMDRGTAGRVAGLGNL
jgi:hypothetical protein